MPGQASRCNKSDDAVDVTHRIIPQVHNECLGSLPLQLLQCLGYLAGSGLGEGGEVQETNGGLPLAAAGGAVQALQGAATTTPGCTLLHSRGQETGMTTTRDDVAGGKDCAVQVCQAMECGACSLFTLDEPDRDRQLPAAPSPLQQPDA